MSAPPFEKYRVAVTGDPFAHFVVSVQPAHWRYQDIGGTTVEQQRQFIADAIREKLQREQGEKA